MVYRIKFAFLEQRSVMKIVLIFILFGLVLSGCKDKDDNKIEQDDLLIKLKSEIASILFNQLKSGSIEYFAGADKYSEHTKKIFSLLDYSINQSRKVNVADCKRVINDYSKPECFQKQSTDFEISVYKTIVLSLNNKTIVETFLILDVAKKFVLDNICDSNQQDKFLYLIASLNQAYIYKLEHSLLNDSGLTLKSADIIALQGSAWDYCWDRCMSKKYDEYNLVDWVQFALNPPADVAWNTASCAWDCSWK